MKMNEPSNFVCFIFSFLARPAPQPTRNIDDYRLDQKYVRGQCVWCLVKAYNVWPNGFQEDWDETRDAYDCFITICSGTTCLEGNLWR